MLPQTNATLLSITTGESGTVEDWGQPATVGTDVKWAGSEDAYVMEKVRTAFASEGGMTKVKDVRIILPSAIFDGSPLETGDVLTYQFQGVTHVRRVMDYSNPYLPGMNIQEYTVAHLNPEPLENALEQE